MAELPELIQILFEIILLTIQLTLILVLLIFFPIIWYAVVNRLRLKEIFNRLKLKLEGIDVAFLWGIFSAIIMFIVVFIIGLVLVFLGQNTEELSNVSDLEQLFSFPSLLLLVAIQPIAEEIFFRGFLLEKFESLAGAPMAILTTSILFGLAHMSYGKIYPVVLPIVFGIILGYVVIKTKNLYSAILAHVIFNVIVIVISKLSQFLASEALIL
jgi:membrane protease YdiL (CAAX protease family)